MIKVSYLAAIVLAVGAGIFFTCMAFSLFFHWENWPLGLLFGAVSMVGSLVLLKE